MKNNLYRGLAALLLFVATNQIFAAIPTSERDVLIALYNSTDGANWRLGSDDGWLGAEGTECEWSGITCSGGHVTEINRHGVDLAGAISSELRWLTQLIKLDLGENDSLTGTIPKELGQLAQLEYLDLSNTYLTGAIPIELGQLSQLKYLDLSVVFISDSYKLIGSIPVELGQLSQLEYLDLSGNYLIGKIPVELAQLTQLVELDLSFNNLRGMIPIELAQLTQLIELNLSFNALTGLIPVELGQLTQLKMLALAFSGLTGTIPVELGQLTQLKELDLFGNHLTGTIPVELGQLVQLKHLDLRENQLTGAIPVELGQLVQLKHLDLGENYLTSTIPVELGQLVQLEQLHLEENQLADMIPAELGQLAQLKYLDLGENYLTGTIPVELGQLVQLKHLYLKNNCLSTPDPDLINFLNNTVPFSYWQNQRIDCTLPVNSIQGRVFNLTGQGLVLQNNGTDSLGIDESGKFIFSTALAEGNNYAVTVFKQPTGQDQDQICTVINGEGSISDTNITDIGVNCVDVFTAIPASERDALIALYNSTDGANWLPGSNDRWLGTEGTECEWSGITCSRGHVTEINRRGVDLAGTIPSELRWLTQLTRLDLGKNDSLTDMIPVELGQLTQLEYLDLGGNHLTGTIPVELEQLTQLRYLRLEGNCLSTMDPDLINFLNNTVPHSYWQKQRTDCLLPTNSLQGRVFNLTGQGLVLQNNGTDSLSIDASGKFIFPTALTEGNSYAVTVFKQPTSRNQVCTVTNGEGSIADINITDIDVNCVDTLYIGGDADGNGNVDIIDIVAGINTILSGKPTSKGTDCNNDGEMNIQDIICTINKVLAN